MRYKIFSIVCLGAMLAVSGIAITANRLNQNSGKKATEHANVDQIATAAAQVLYDEMEQPSKRQISAILVRASRCIAVVPSRLRLGLVVVGSYGNGIVSCRIDKDQWSAPVFFSLSTMSVGPQAGIESTELVLLFMDQSMDILEKGKVELGADIEVTAGTSTAYKEVFIKPDSVVAYQQRSEGLFAGADIEGATIIINDEKNRQVYGYDFDLKKTLHGKQNTKNVPDPIKSYAKTVKKFAWASQNK